MPTRSACRRLSRPAAALTLLVLAPLGAAQATAFDPARSDPKAVAVAEQVMQALGGEDAWRELRHLRFDFQVERGGTLVMRRAHTWDKWTGRYRLEGRTREGQAYRVVMDLHTRQGRAWLEGRALDGEALRQRLDDAYATWVNDTYWLLMPYKMKDPGVSLKLDGERVTAEGAWDKVLLTFDGVGLTPKDRYWAFVNRATHLVDRWEFVLKGETAAPTPFDWRGWREYGRVKLAPERVNPDNGTRISFPVLETPATLPDDTFAPPE